MQAAQFSGSSLSNGLTNRHTERNAATRRKRFPFPDQCSSEVGNFSPVDAQKRSCSLENGRFSPLVACFRKANFPVIRNQLSSDYGVGSPDVDEFPSPYTVENDPITKEGNGCIGSGKEAL